METMRESRLVVLHALTFLHPGTGQTTGVVDLPIQREIHTGFPMIASSGLKGSLRDKAECDWGKGGVVDEVFGSDPGVGSEVVLKAGALAVTDARILAFPVRSLQKVFVWVTCPMVLRRLRRDMELGGLSVAGIPLDLRVQTERVLAPRGGGFQSPLVLEEIAFEVVPQLDLIGVTTPGGAGKGITALFPDDMREEIADRLVAISDEDFQYLVRHATQVSARIALNERKTTTGDGGNLWYEETLPPETIMYALLVASKPRNGGEGLKDASGVIMKVEELFATGYLQVGGNETVGQGWCRVVIRGDRQ